MAMAFMLVLVTIVIAMHTSQARATRTVTQAEAELQFRQSAEFAAAKLLLGSGSPPDTLRVEAKDELISDQQMPKLYATKLWSGLPDWDPKEDQEYAPGHQTYKLTPTTHDEALKVFAGRFQWLVAHNEGGYAVYAPNGNVALRQGIGWANPDFLDQRPVGEAYSGVPFLVAAKGSITAEAFPYGSAYSLDGPLDLGNAASDLGVAFQGAFPLRAYETELRKTLQDARTSLEGAASSGNKTSEISGGVLAGAGSVIDMVVNGNPGALNISLQQAMSFPFPMIPGFSNTVPGVFFEFWFHMPYAPDFYRPESEDDGSGQKNAEKVHKLDQEIKQLESQIAQLNAQIAATSDDDERDDLIDERNDKQDKLNDKRDEMESIQTQLQSDASLAQLEIANSSSQPASPKTRNDDATIPKTGIKGWAYGPLMSNMLNLLTSVLTGDLEGIGESFKADVRLVHFGGKDNDCNPGFRFQDGFSCEATFTVPRGRSFRYDGKMSVSGDLWLQKGSVMHVTGDLEVSNPSPGSSSALKPSGKLVMEEGATLIVGGDLRCEGDPRFGSLWVCSPPTQVAPVTSAIFVQGSATLPYGSYSAATLDDAARAVSGSAALGDALETFFTDVAPNLAKVEGPFHERKPYFASYAATFQLTIVPTPFGPVPIPTPIPLPKKNILVPMFRALSMTYAGTLNMNLGENLYTHADWWGYGEGVVPAMIKLNPLGPMNAIKGLSLTGLDLSFDWQDTLTELTTSVMKEAAAFAITQVGKKLVTAVMTSALPGGSVISNLIDEVFDVVDVRESSFVEFRQKIVDAALGPIVSKLEDVKNKVEDEIHNGLAESYLREVSGPLLYADSISVGDPNDPPRLMAGMLVAENALTVHTESFVGSLTSFQGNITAPRVYFTPLFTRASLYRPKATANSALGRTTEFEYGKRFHSDQAIDVGTGVVQITTEGWNR